MSKAPSRSVTVTLPTADLKPRRRLGLIWLLPAATLLLAG